MVTDYGNDVCNAVMATMYPFHYGICHSGAFDSPELFQYVCTVSTVLMSPTMGLPPQYHNGLYSNTLHVENLSAYTQVFPGSLLPSTFADPERPDRLLGRSELERRRDYIQPLHEQLGEQHPLVQLVHQCLHNNPHQRPSAEELLQRLEATRVRIERSYGSYHFKVQSAMMSVEEREMKEKDREIEHLPQELHQLQVL